LTTVGKLHDLSLDRRIDMLASRYSLLGRLEICNSSSLLPAQEGGGRGWMGR